MKKIVIFASGSGSNAQRICEYFAGSTLCKVSHILTNNPNAGVIQRAENLSVPCKIFNRTDFFETSEMLNWLKNEAPDLIVLAGFLWKIPTSIVDEFTNKIINIHPSLLPKYGGRGMYGENVHKAVLENKEKQSGITIHYVNAHYDEGQIIFQYQVAVFQEDTPNSLAQKIHEIEHRFFPKVIEEILMG